MIIFIHRISFNLQLKTVYFIIPVPYPSLPSTQRTQISRHRRHLLLRQPQPDNPSEDNLKRRCRFLPATPPLLTTMLLRGGRRCYWWCVGFSARPRRISVYLSPLTVRSVKIDITGCSLLYPTSQFPPHSCWASETGSSASDPSKWDPPIAPELAAGSGSASAASTLKAPASKICRAWLLRRFHGTSTTWLVMEGTYDKKEELLSLNIHPVDILVMMAS